MTRHHGQEESTGNLSHRREAVFQGNLLYADIAVDIYLTSPICKKQQNKVGTKKEATTAAELRFKHSKISNIYCCITCSPGNIFLRLSSRVRGCCLSRIHCSLCKDSN